MKLGLVPIGLAILRVLLALFIVILVGLCATCSTILFGQWRSWWYDVKSAPGFIADAWRGTW